MSPAAFSPNCFLKCLRLQNQRGVTCAWRRSCVRVCTCVCVCVYCVCACMCVGAHVRRSALHSCARFWSEAGYCLLWKYYCKCLLLLRCETVGVLCALHGLCGGIVVLVVLVSGGWSGWRWGGGGGYLSFSLLLLTLFPTGQPPACGPLHPG